jgi:hypothetical protein
MGHNLFVEILFGFIRHFHWDQILLFCSFYSKSTLFLSKQPFYSCLSRLRSIWVLLLCYNFFCMDLGGWLFCDFDLFAPLLGYAFTYTHY